MNLYDIPNRIGYRLFDCSECERHYILLCRDRFSPSKDECPYCGECSIPFDNCGIDEIAEYTERRWVVAVHRMIREIGGPTGYTREETAQIEILEQLLKRMEASNE